MPLRWSLLDRLVDLLLVIAAYTHVILSPYSKVEESFSFQAVHDILSYGFHPACLVKYDHNVFPGAVPRSFIGPIVLSIISYPVLAFFNFLGLIQSSADTALIVRLILATLLAASLIFFSYRVHNDRTQFPHRRAFIIICSIQFHLMFWAGRTTPNGLVSPVVIFALALVFSASRLRHHAEQYYTGLGLLTASSIIARLELVGIVIPVAICGLFCPSLGGNIVSRFALIALTGLTVAEISIAASVLVDTYFWARPFLVWNPLQPSTTQVRGLLWPELEAILFNVVQGKSSDWGTSPWHTYLTVFAPKLESFVTPLCLFGMTIKSKTRFAMLVVVGSHIAIMSQLGHKELRFISYLNPILNVFAARGVVAMWRQDQRRHFLLRIAGKTIVVLSLAATAFLTAISLIASANNHPGGEAMRVLHDAVHGQNVTVHIDVLPAMTGVNLFQSVYLPRPQSSLGISWLSSITPPSLDENQSWTYDKTENLQEENDRQWQHFTHLISDTPDCHLPKQFELLVPDAFVEFKRLSLKRPKQWISSLVTSPRICLQEGLLDWTCFDSLSPVQFQWREAVWLCRRIE